MICPSCGDALGESVKHCIHCGIGITRRSVQMAQVINNCGWVARRALGGFFAGSTGCLIAMAVVRAGAAADGSGASRSLTEVLAQFPGQQPFATAIAGCFFGVVGGIIERSAYKSLLGGGLGLIGGLIGGLSYSIFENLFRGQLYGFSLAMAGAWSIAGAMVGLSSGLLEGTRSKITAGIVGGLLGGAVGGGVGSQMYGALLMEIGAMQSPAWAASRAIEMLSGGIIGALMWFSLGAAEKLYIFRRRQMVGATKKVCDFCHFENVLKAWYCGQCGSALQVAANREQIQPTPFRGLERVSNAFLFLSWLSSSVGVVMGIVIFVSFAVQNFLFGLFGALIVGLVIYIVSILFKAAAEMIRIGIQVTDRLSRENVTTKGG